MEKTQISQNDVDGFKANLNLSPQQTDSVYVNAVSSDLAYSKDGKLFNADDVGKSDPTDTNEIVPDSPEGLVDQTRRVGAFKGMNDGKFVDPAAVANQLVDPTGEVIQAMMAGKWRAYDRTIRTGFFAPVRIGESGEGTKAFPSSRIIAANSRKFIHQDETVAASGDLPITIGKLLNARSLLNKGRVKGERFIACDSDDISQLLSTTPTTNKFYSSIARLEAGEIDTFLGFKFLMDEDLPDSPNGSTKRILPCWVKPAVIFKARSIVEATITKRADKSFRTYAYYETQRGVCRRYDEGVVGIEVLKPA